MKRLSEERSGCSTPVAFTPRVQADIARAKSGELKDPNMCDTFFSSGTFAAAAAAAGSVRSAVDAVLAGQCRNAMCLVRPPGHHAGPQGLLQDCVSCGFCIFNSVALGAQHALRSGCRKVAIFDFDAHHGNGTEEIIKQFKRSDSVLFISVHLYDADHKHLEGYIGQWRGRLS